MAKGKNFIQEAIKKPGALHKSLKVPLGKKIPMDKIKEAEHSKSKLLKRRAKLAETLAHLRRKK